jgi:hypothetical protein
MMATKVFHLFNRWILIHLLEHWQLCILIIFVLFMTATNAIKLLFKGTLLHLWDVGDPGAKLLNQGVAVELSTHLETLLGFCLLAPTLFLFVLSLKLELVDYEILLRMPFIFPFKWLEGVRLYC